MAGIDYNKISIEFMKNGFFSEYLPAAFTLENDFDIFSIDLNQKSDLVEPLSFNMSRFTEGGNRRTIYLPELASYLATVKYMNEHHIIKDLIMLAKDVHSFSPLVQKNGEMTRHERDYNFGVAIGQADQDAIKSTYIPNIVDKIQRSKGSKGILSVDISNFYPSIYTHLIPCIKLGYDEAELQYKASKANNADPIISDDYRKYVKLDLLIRNMNVGRTNGLLPGILISQFLAESLLSRVDKELKNCGLNFVRYVDDYEIFIYDENQINRIHNSVVSTLKKFFLVLNNEKTKYTKFPFYVVENLEKIYSNYTGKPIEPSEVMKMFNTYFELEANGTKGAIRFLIKSIDQSFVCPNKKLYTAYLLNVLVNDGRSLVKVCQLMIKDKQKLKFSDEDIFIIENLLVQHLDANNHLEAIWLLYLRRKLGKKKLSAKLIYKILYSTNELAIVMLIEEFESSLSTKMKEECKGIANSWILCYQLYLHNYFTKDSFIQKSKIKNNVAFYSALKRNNFTFYKHDT
ncbi:RNA-directed DNA polymerase [Aminipila sp.]|uniref:RNA-directed DNA polymerase n=1 Tax=Aminipila sp. TaxID=2060095 RepID=UPI0028A123C9|nr:RNA-directed DNA polymerase [Aminipila sp.]